MNLEAFKAIVIQHRTSVILIGIMTLIFCIVGIFFVEFFTRKMGVRYFQIGRMKFPLSMLLIIPILATVIFYSIDIINCNKDISNSSYETYIGYCIYDDTSVTLEEEGLNFYVGKGHKIVPDGRHYGKCIYSKHAKVIVYWEEMDME